MWREALVPEFFRFVNDKLVSAGRIPAESEVMTGLAEALN